MLKWVELFTGSQSSNAEEFHAQVVRMRNNTNNPSHDLYQALVYSDFKFLHSADTY